MKFKVVVTETLEKAVYIDAEDRADAEEIAQEMWNNEEIVLTADDFVEASFSAEEV